MTLKVNLVFYFKFKDLIFILLYKVKFKFILIV